MGNQYSSSSDSDPLILKVPADTVPYSFEQYQIEIIKLAILEKGLEFKEQKQSIKNIIKEGETDCKSNSSQQFKLPRLEVDNYKQFCGINKILEVIDDQYSEKKIYLIPGNYKDRELMQSLIKQMLYFIDIQDFQIVGQIKNQKHKKEFMEKRIQKIILKLKEGQKLLQNQANEEIQKNQSQNDENDLDEHYKKSNNDEKQVLSSPNQKGQFSSINKAFKKLLSLNDKNQFLNEQDIFNSSYIDNNEKLFNQMSSYDLKNFAQSFHNPIVQLQEKIKEYEILLDKIQEYEYIYENNQQNCLKILQNLDDILMNKIKKQQKTEINDNNNNQDDSKFDKLNGLQKDKNLNLSLNQNQQSNNKNQEQNKQNGENQQKNYNFYLVGDNFTLADVVGCVFIKLLRQMQFTEKLGNFKFLNQYYEQIQQREAFKQLLGLEKKIELKNQFNMSVYVIGIIMVGIFSYYCYSRGVRDRAWGSFSQNNRYNGF